MNKEQAIAELSDYAAAIEGWDWGDIRTGEIYAAARHGVLDAIEVLRALPDEPRWTRETIVKAARDEIKKHGGGDAFSIDGEVCDGDDVNQFDYERVRGICELRDAILAADEVETDGCQCRDGGGGSIDMRDCVKHLRACYGWPPAAAAEPETVGCPICKSPNLIPMLPHDPEIHRPGIMCLECSAFFEEVVESGCTEFEEINECPAGSDTHLLGFWENLNSGHGEPRWIAFEWCPLCGARLSQGDG